MTEIDELRAKIKVLEDRISQIESCFAYGERMSDTHAVRIAKIKELVALSDGMIRFSDIRKELGISKARLSVLLHWLKQDPDFKIITDPANKRNKYVAYRDYEATTQTNEATEFGYVYVIKSPKGVYKLGISHDPKRRLREFTTGNPDGLVLIHTIKCDNPHLAEKFIHDKYNIKRVNGEWFALNEADIKLLRSIKYISDDSLRLLV